MLYTDQINTKIADFKIGDTFVYYDGLFEVTGDCKTFDSPSYANTTVYGRTCRFIKPRYDNANAKHVSWLISGYDWMQGTEEVMYAKVID